MTCLNCNSPIVGSGKKYCSNKCQIEYQRLQYLKKWKEGVESGFRGKYWLSKIIRDYLFDKNDHKCSKCGWSEINPYTGKIPLEVNHIDGNYENNKEENLEVVCPNCHSLTPTYKALNKKNGGRAWRRKQAQML